MTRRCVNCGATKLAKSEVEHKFRVGREMFPMALPTMTCRSCGESFIDGAELAHAELEVAAMLIDAHFVNGDAFRFMRKTLGLKATDLAGLLGVRSETISHWETGTTAVTRTAFAALAAMVIDKMGGATSR